MLVWVIILVALSGFLFAQNIALWRGDLQLPPMFQLTILWSVLILLVALGVLITLVVQRRTRAGPKPSRAPAPPRREVTPGPPKPEAAEEPREETREQPPGGPEEKSF